MGSYFESPFAAFRTEEQEPPTVANLERRLSMAERAADQARRDLATEKSRKGLTSAADDKDEKIERWARQGALAERERILAILTNPIAARQPRLADTFAFQSDIPAAEAVAAMEAQAPHADATQRSAKEMAAKIVHMGKVRRGEVAAPVTGAGPKNFVTATPEAISAAAKKARGEA
jgi:alkylhydroperoxidase/carboxymuconolactone decarboxylase family protein YurZ